MSIHLFVDTEEGSKLVSCEVQGRTSDMTDLSKSTKYYLDHNDITHLHSASFQKNLKQILEDINNEEPIEFIGICIKPHHNRLISKGVNWKTSYRWIQMIITGIAKEFVIKGNTYVFENPQNPINFYSRPYRSDEKPVRSNLRFKLKSL